MRFGVADSQVDALLRLERAQVTFNSLSCKKLTLLIANPGVVAIIKPHTKQAI